MSSNRNVWVLAEYEQKRLNDASLQLVSGSRQLADKLKEDVCVIVFSNYNEELAGALADYGADKVFFLDSPLLSHYSSEPYTQALSSLLRDEKAGIFLCGNSPIGKDLMPRLAAELETGLVTDCVSLDIDSTGTLVSTKPTYAGEVYTRFTFSSARPWLLTVSPAVMEAQKSTKVKTPDIISIPDQLNDLEPLIKTIGFMKGNPKEIGIEEAEIIVAGGRGIGSIENFRLIEELAEVLGASVAGSLQAVDAGWIGLERQVGQTGKTVSPRLYIACGISGTSYHTLGMKDSEIVIAINTDRHAPIFQMADVGIVADFKEVVPAITEKLRKMIKPGSDINHDGGNKLY